MWFVFASACRTSVLLPTCRGPKRKKLCRPKGGLTVLAIILQIYHEISQCQFLASGAAHGASGSPRRASAPETSMVQVAAVGSCMKK